MSSSNKASGNNDGRGKKSNFDSVPADDGFRNYMARKIELQRKQFGLVVPPPPPPEPKPQPEPKPAPPKILKKTRLARSNDGSPMPRFQGTNSVHDNHTKVRSEKSVRFHHEVEVEGETEAMSVSHVLANLKQKLTGGRKRSSSAYKRRRRSREDASVGDGSSEPNVSHSSVLGVLGSLQKRHGAGKSSLKRKQPHSDSQSSKSENVGDDDISSSTPTKRKRGSPRCSGKSILEGLEPTIHINGQDESRECGGPDQQGAECQSNHSSDQSSHAQLKQPPSELSQTLECDAPSSPLEHDASESLAADSQTSLMATETATQLNSAQRANHRPDLFFTGVVVLVNGHTSPDATTLMRLLHKHGGDLEKYETGRVTHIIAEQLSGAKANIYKKQKKPTPVVRPEWITDSVEQWKLLPYGDYLLKDVMDEGVAGIKSMKSFFSSKPEPTNASIDSNRDSNSGLEEASIVGETSWHRWQDTEPSKAKYHLNGQVRTVGNDPHFLESYFRNSRLSYIGSFKQRIKPAKTSSPSRRKSGSKRFVLLIDMDCFFAAVVLRKYPQYRDKPVAVGHCHVGRSNVNETAEMAKTSKKNSSSELSTCNYIARKYGIRKGMFLGDAIELCPDLVVLPYDFEGYEEVAGVVAEQLHGFAEIYNGCVEQVSCDESYVEINVSPDDCHGKDTHDFLNTLAEHIRADIVKKTECTASVGIGPNKLLAKLAADKVKPNAFCVVKDWRDFLDNVSLRDIPGVGRKLQKKLEAHGLRTTNDVWDLDDDADNVIGSLLGHGNSKKIVQYCHGKDDRPVTPAVRKSIGAECNYGVRFEGPYGVDYMMKGLAREVETRMAGAGVRGSKLTLKVMKSKDPSKVPGKFLGHGRCDSFSRSVDIPLTLDQDVISSAALKLFERLEVDTSSVRGMGIVISSLKLDADAMDSSPSKLSSWLTKDCTSPTGKKSQEADIDSPRVSFSEADLVSRSEPDPASVNFAIDENAHRAATFPTAGSGSSTMPTFSQLDPDVLQSLPEDILAEVKSTYKKGSSQTSQTASQLSSTSPKRNASGKASRNEKQIPIAGQTSVKRMFKLASIKSGEEQLSESGVSLTQLDNLPLELQLQLANSDSIEIAKRPRHKPSAIQGAAAFAIDHDVSDADESMGSLQQVAPECHSPQNLSIKSNFHKENIAPLREFISLNPNPDDEVVGTVREFLFVCIHEKRVNDAVTFLRTIKNMNDGWDGEVYTQLKESTVDKVYASTGNVLDTSWLGI